MCYFQVVMSKVYYNGKGSYRVDNTYSIDEFIDIFNKKLSDKKNKCFNINDLDTLLSLTGATLKEISEE